MSPGDRGNRLVHRRRRSADLEAWFPGEHSLQLSHRRWLVFHQKHTNHTGIRTSTRAPPPESRARSSAAWSRYTVFNLCRAFHSPRPFELSSCEENPRPRSRIEMVTNPFLRFACKRI